MEEGVDLVDNALGYIVAHACGGIIFNNRVSLELKTILLDLALNGSEEVSFKADGDEEDFKDRCKTIALWIGDNQERDSFLSGLIQEINQRN